MLDFSELDISPEEYDINILNNVPDNVIRHSEMHVVERQFLNGLIRLEKPKNILEIGVSGGAGSVVILNAIADMPDSHLFSYDIAYDWYMDTSKKIGFCVDLMWPDGNPQWSLSVGKDVSECVGEFPCKFDFVVIDTAHIHPVESLNFISVLPYLNDGAVVVFHDLALFTKDDAFAKFPMMSLANKLAYDTIVGKKLEPRGQVYRDFNFGISSIGAVQVTGTTREYIENIFNMLNFPWASFSYTAEYVFAVAKIVKKYYSPKLLRKLCDAISLNARLEYNDYKYKLWNEEAINDFVKANEFIIYGAGKSCDSILNFIEHNEFKKPNIIWDRDLSKEKVLHGVPVELPKFDILNNYQNVVLVVSIKNEEVFRSMKEMILSNNKNVKVYSYKELYLAIIYDRLSKLTAE